MQKLYMKALLHLIINNLLFTLATVCLSPKILATIYAMPQPKQHFVNFEPPDNAFDREIE